MGSLVTRVLPTSSRGWTKQDVRIVLLGLDSAGKTTLLYKMKLNEVVTTYPTIGMNVSSSRDGTVLCCWDSDGRVSISDN